MNWYIIICAIITASIFGYGQRIDLNDLTEGYQNGVEDNFYGVVETPYDESPRLKISTTSETNDIDYDFIIIGSGSAGSVIANRLSEMGGWKILLLEAGYPENSLAQFPALASIFQFTNYNWAFSMEPQNNICLAMNEQRCTWPRGKALGGSTVINNMVYTRGNPHDYNNWAAQGNPGWSYSEVLPYFLKSENSQLRISNPKYHNRGGYQSVEDPYPSDLGDTFIKAGIEFGYNYTDYNSPDQIGFSRIQATMKFGRRQSTASAFLKPILHRENLRIITGARVIKILIDPESKRTYGVTYVKNNYKISVRVKKEVILSAGVLNSPQLLMLSGVGRREHLEELGIETVIDLPVGETLYDHVVFFGLVLNTNLTLGSFRDLFEPRSLLRWYTRGEGGLARISGSEAIAFIKTNISDVDQGYPDIELYMSGESLPGDSGTINRKLLGISDDYYHQMYSSLEGTPSFSIRPILLHPKSKGYMKLRSADPYDYPLFYGNYLTDPENSDTETLIAGIRFIIKLSEAKVFKKYDVRFNRKPFVGCEELSFDSDEYWYCALKLTATTANHQTSTCKMGPTDDPTAVVNHELKVYGVGNLRVADASIVPLPLSAHMSAPTIMVGEMASDLIKKDWGVL